MLRKRIKELLPWISDELEKFAVDEIPVTSFVKKISDGNDEKFYGVKFSRMIDVSGKFSGIIIHLEDLTSQKQADEEMRKSEALQGVLEMAGAVCHELNQPLQALYGYSQLLMMDIDDKHPLYERISKIEHQVERVGAITGKLSEITRYKTKDYLKGKIIDIEKATDDAP